MPDYAATAAAEQPIEFIDPGARRRRLGRSLDEAILRVLGHGRYIMGPEVTVFERELAEFCGVRHVFSCANGIDALGLALMVLGVKAGQAVLVPSFTFAATAEVVAWYGRRPGLCRCPRRHLQHRPGELRSRDRSCPPPRPGAGRGNPGRSFGAPRRR